MVLLKNAPSSFEPQSPEFVEGTNGRAVGNVGDSPLI
jgi:hypothetical protein